MATLFLLDGAGDVVRRACPVDRPLLLGNDLREPGAGEVSTRWPVAIVPFVVTPRSPRRWALVVRPGVSVALGATTACGGVVELRDRDRLLFGERETMFSTDALPEPVKAETPPSPCPVCCESTEDGDLFRCPRCGTRACHRCWDIAPLRECLTPGCHQPAAFDRALWAPTTGDFITWDREELG